MMIMRLFPYRACTAALLVWVCGALHAAYEPNVNPSDYPKDEVRKGLQAMKSLPKIAREAIIAEKLALLFLTSGEGAYGDEHLAGEHGTKWFDVKSQAKFMSSSGKLTDYHQVLNEVRKKKLQGTEGWDVWVHAKQGICAVGEEVIFSSYVADVTKMVQQTAKRHLNSVPQILRDAWLAEWGGLLFMPDGSSAYDSPKPTKKYGTFSAKKEFAMVCRKPGAQFIDSKGEQKDADAVWKEHVKNVRNEKILFSACWCAGLIGAEDILSLFPKEVKAMKAAAKAAKP